MTVSYGVIPSPIGGARTGSAPSKSATAFADPEGMEGWVVLVGWPIADTLPTKRSHNWLPVWFTTGKCWLLCHATNVLRWYLFEENTASSVLWWLNRPSLSLCSVRLSPLRVRWNGTHFHTHSGTMLGVPIASDRLSTLIFLRCIGTFSASRHCVMRYLIDCYYCYTHKSSKLWFWLRQSQIFVLHVTESPKTRFFWSVQTQCVFSCASHASICWQSQYLYMSLGMNMNVIVFSVLNLLCKSPVVC